ncbi:hypothetical protein RA279_28490, partial [Pseudomonas syringae pv. tagetis]|uniref:hypothetical protein n=1 Tax=Pseudomonas syringae group genomosp. 7 TaxID=251699 RepID=UPI00376F798F
LIYKFLVFAFFSLFSNLALRFAPEAREYISDFYAVVLYVYSVNFAFSRCFGLLRRLRRHLSRTRARLPSQALRASSPGGRAKCTPVD